MRFFKNKTALFLAALGIRLLAGVWLGHFSNPQSWEPEILANNLLMGKGFLYDNHLGIPYRAYLLPAYPVFCAVVYFLTHHSHLFLLFLQCALSAAACLQVHGIGRLAFPDPKIARGGAWLTVLHPGLVFYASLLHPLTLDLFSYLWVLWACLRFFKEPKISTAIPLGLAAGLALLSRGTILPFLLLAVAGFLLKAARQEGLVVRPPIAAAARQEGLVVRPPIAAAARQEGLVVRPPIAAAARHHMLKKAAFTVALVFTVTLLAVLPWLFRNAALFGRFPIFITSGSQSLWQGNNPLSVGTAHLPDGRPIIGQLPADLKTALAKTGEIGQSDLFQREAVSFIRRNPASAVGLFLRKSVIFWWFSPTTGIYYPASYTAWYRFYQLALLSLALVGFWFMRDRLFSFPVVLLWLFLISVTSFQALYYVEGRHRWIVEPVLLLFSACGIFLWKRAPEEIRQRTAQSYSVLWKEAYGRPLGEEIHSYHLEEIQESLGLEAPKGRILDAGCGEGIDLANQGRRPGAKIIGVELSRGGCWASLQRIRHLAAAHVVQADLSHLPFSDGTFDFIYSYGVLHHMAVPSRGLRELVRAAKPGAWVAVYLYEDFEDRHPIWRVLLWFGNCSRHLTTRLPHRFLYALCLLASPFFYLLFTVPFLLFHRIRFLRRWVARMPFRHASGPWDLAGDLYDRFATPMEYRYSRSSAETFLREAGLLQIRINNRRGWMAAGMKP